MQRAGKQIKIRGVRAIMAALGLLAALSVAGCGTSTVSMMAVRPAFLNARAYGGTVSVAGFMPVYPDYALVAGQLQREVAERIANGSVPGSVQLLEYGGGLSVSGRVDLYAAQLHSRERMATCNDPIKVDEGKGSITKYIDRPCTWRWLDWTCQVVVTTQVTDAGGRVLLIRPISAQRSGSTMQVRDIMPTPPNSHPILQELRMSVAEQIAWLVAAHRERVNVVFYNCEKPAKATCEVGVQRMAEGRYDEAAAAFTDALAQLDRAGANKDDRAKVLWNRALVFEFSRQFDQAEADLRAAYALDDERQYRDQIGAVERERAAHQQLLEQGLGPQPQAPK